MKGVIMEGNVYLIVFGFVFLVSSMLSVIIAKRIIRDDLDELFNSVKLDISESQMEQSERNISCFYSDNNLTCDCSIWEIAEILNVKQGDDVSGLAEQAQVSSPDEDGFIVVTFREGLPQEKKNFTFAHECAHIINKDPLPNARLDGKNKPISEQLADYTAAAILMPKEKVYPYLKKNNYDKLSARRRVMIVNKLCREYEVSQIIALRRIKEIYELEKNGFCK